MSVEQNRLLLVEQPDQGIHIVHLLEALLYDKTFFVSNFKVTSITPYEPCHEKTCFWHMQKLKAQ